MQIDHDFLWRVLEGALGTEKVAYLRYSPLDEIVLNKMAQDYPEQTLPKYVTLPAAARHITEKHAFAKRRWQMVESGIAAIKQLHEQGLYKRAALLPKGSLQRKLAVRDRLLLAASGSPEAREKVAAILPEYDRQLEHYLGPERFKEAQKAKLLSRIGEGISSAHTAIKQTPTGKAALKGIGYGAGAALPLGALGYGMMGSAEEKAKGMLLPAMAAGAGSSLLGGIGSGLGEAIGERIGGG